jgi:phosphoesterase RecJ-like protein
MPINPLLIRQAGDKLQEVQKILLATHIRPDGDAIGSILGLGLALQNAGKTVQMISQDGVPANLRFLEGSDQIRKRPEGEFDLLCVVDCSDPERSGSQIQGRGQPDINIDHHITNLAFGRVNLIDSTAVATAELIADFLPEWGFELTRPIADALLTGLITDTIGFRTSSITPKAMRLTARLMETGADMPDIYRRALVNRSFEAVHLWGAGLGKAERDGRLVWTTLTLADRKAANYKGLDEADMLTVLGAVEDTDIAIVFNEQSDGHVKVSWRAQPGYDVSGIALQFGGGGHAAASGAEIQGALPDIQTMVLDQTRLLLNGGYHV